MDSSKPSLVQRAGYTYSNALKWKRFYDAALSSKKDILIHWTKDSPMAIPTMKNRICDGLKWLAENNIDDFVSEPSDFKQEDYRGLKLNTTVLTVQNEGIMISFKFGRRSKPTSNFDFSPVDRVANDNWRENLLKYMTEGDGIFHMDNLVLTQDDIDWIHRATSGCEVNVNQNKLTVVK